MLPTSKIQAIGLLVAVAVAGFAAGAATRGAATPAPTDWRERCSYSGMLHDRLGLTDTQRDSIRALMRSNRPAMDALMRPMRPQMDSMRSAMREKVRAVLTPEQRSRYDSLIEHERQERQQHGDSGRAGPGGF